MPKSTGKEPAVPRGDMDEINSGGQPRIEKPRPHTTNLRKAGIGDNGNGHHESLPASDDYKQSPNYSDEVMLRLVNLLYDPLSSLINLMQECGIHPDEAHLLGLTRVNSSREAWMWAQQIAREAAYEHYVNGKEIKMTLRQIRRMAFLLLRRSIPGECGPGFMLAVGLAGEQNIVKSEEEVEGQDW